MVQSVEPTEAQGGTGRFRSVVAPGLLSELGGAAGWSRPPLPAPRDRSATAWAHRRDRRVAGCARCATLVRRDRSGWRSRADPRHRGERARPRGRRPRPFSALLLRGARTTGRGPLGGLGTRMGDGGRTHPDRSLATAGRPRGRARRRPRPLRVPSRRVRVRRRARTAARFRLRARPARVRRSRSRRVRRRPRQK